MPVKELIETLSAAKTFIGRTSQINHRSTVSIKDGSIHLDFDTPHKTLEYMNSKSGLIEYDNSEPLSQLVSTLSQIAVAGGVNVEVKAGSAGSFLIDYNGLSNFQIKQSIWLEATLVLNGPIIEIGGRNPNIHIDTEEYGIKTIAIDQRSIREFSIYEVYAVEVDVLQNWDYPREFKNATYRSHIHIGNPISFGVFVQQFDKGLNPDIDVESLFDDMRNRKDDY